MPAYRCTDLACRRITFRPRPDRTCASCGSAVEEANLAPAPPLPVAVPPVPQLTETDAQFGDFKRGKAAADIPGIGFPLKLRHLEAFQRAADTMSSVVISRGVGIACRTLIEEGHGMKDFRIHGKSCDFGPMAGMVCLDPRLSKKGLGGLEFNAKSHLMALAGIVENQPTFESFGTKGGVMTQPSTKAPRRGGWKASWAPIFISEARRQELMDGWGGTKPLGENPKQDKGGEWSGVCVKGDLRVPWRLIKSGGSWAVCIDDPNPPFRQQRPAVDMITDESKRAKLAELLGDAVPSEDAIVIPKHRSVFTGREYEQVMAMVNASLYRAESEPDEIPENKRAITGDYDLFAVWPTRETFEQEGIDKRLGAMHSLTRESQMRGNLSQRIAWAGALLNDLCYASDNLGYARVVCHHSDENFRPFISDVDLPLIAFVPGATQAVGIETIRDFKTFVEKIIGLGYRPCFNQLWFAEYVTESLTMDKAKSLLRALNAGGDAALEELNLLDLAWAKKLEKAHGITFPELKMGTSMEVTV